MANLPNAGDLKSRVELLKRTDNPINSWETQNLDVLIGKYWCKIEPIGATSYWLGMQNNQAVTHRFWLRSILNKTNAHSITHGVIIKHLGFMYQPLRVIDYETFTAIECKEIGDYKLENSLIDEVIAYE